MTNILQKINKFYLGNTILFATIIFSVLLMFIIQFKVESLANQATQIEAEISSFEDEIQLLELEWVYLTRSDRLRELASEYLKDNSYALASQIKGVGQLEKYYLVNYKKRSKEEIAMNIALN